MSKRTLLRIDREYLDAVEVTPRVDLIGIQEKALVEELPYVYSSSSFYRNKFKKASVDIEKVRRIADLVKLPITEKNELIEDQKTSRPFGGNACAPIHEVVLYAKTPSVYGKPLYVGFSFEDLKPAVRCMARAFHSARVRAGDKVHLASDWYLLPDFPIAVKAGLELDVCVQQHGCINALRQIKLMAKFQPTVLLTYPTYAMFMRRVMESVSASELARRFNIILGWGEIGYSVPSTRRKLHDLYPNASSICDLYVTCEVGCLGAMCRNSNGIHLYEDRFVVEVVDPKTGELMSPGEAGSILVTTLGRETTPLVRYRVGDTANLVYENCDCGRTLVRAFKIQRERDTFKQSLDLYAIVEMVNSIKGLTGSLVLETKKSRLLCIKCQADVNDAEVCRILQKNLDEKLRSSLGSAPTVRVVERDKMKSWLHRSYYTKSTDIADRLDRIMRDQYKREGEA